MSIEINGFLLIATIKTHIHSCAHIHTYINTFVDAF